MKLWYDQYKDLPYKHLGNDRNIGIDCLNLIILMYKEQLDIIIPYDTKTFCQNLNEDWYNQTHKDLFSSFDNPKWGWKKIAIKNIEVYDVVTINLGSTNVTNHCTMCIDTGKILNIMIDRPSWVAPYGNYYKQYTNGVYRWTGKIDI